MISNGRTNIIFGYCEGRLKATEDLLLKVQSSNIIDENGFLKNQLLNNIDEYQSRIESIWKQKSRETWLLEEDHNTKFFHTSTLIRGRRNIILNTDGRWSSNINDISSWFIHHFNDIFKWSFDDSTCLNNEFSIRFTQCISLEDNNDLLSILEKRVK